MAEIPDQIVLRKHRDLEGRRGNVWRSAILVMLGLFLVAGLLNVFGQRPSNTTVEAHGVSLRLHAPSSLRGGLLYEASFTIHTQRALDHPVLVLPQEWAVAHTINTLEPSPPTQTSQNGKIALGLGPIRAGATYTLFGEFQVNPTSVGRYPGDVWLYNGSKPLLHLRRTITVFP